MNKMKRVFPWILLVAALVSLMGCGAKKEALTAEQFKTFMEEKGLDVIDQTDSVDGEEYQKVYVAVDMEKYSFDYYFMVDDVSARSLYNFMVDKVKANYEGASGTVTLEKNLPSHGDFSISASDYYVRVIRVGNAVLYAASYPDYKDECKQFIKDMGY